VSFVTRRLVGICRLRTGTEDFPAGTTSPRTACLTASQARTGWLLGACYGAEIVAGISIEEEYEAVKLEETYFVFGETVNHEARVLFTCRGLRRRPLYL